MSFLDDVFGGFLGPIGGFVGGLLFPELAIPAEIAGGFLGGTAGGLIEGKPLGQSAIQGVESGAISGIGGAIGAAAGVSPTSIVGDLFGTPAAPEAIPAAGGVGGGAAPVAPAAPAAPATGSPLPAGGAASASGIAGSPMSADQLLGSTGGTSFFGASGDSSGGGFPQFDPSVGGGGAGNISGAPTSSGGGISSDTFYSPGTDTPIGTAGVPGSGVTSGGTIDPSGGGSGISSFISKNWPMLASAGILGIEGLTKNQPLPGEQQLQANATTADKQSQALMAPIQTGVLPPGAQQAVDSSAAASKAGIASTYGGLGLAGSTMEQQAQQGVERNKAAQTYQIATDLLSKGIDLSRLSAADLTTLLDAQLKQDAQFNQSLGTFTSGLAGARMAA